MLQMSESYQERAAELIEILVANSDAGCKAISGGKGLKVQNSNQRTFA